MQDDTTTQTPPAAPNPMGDAGMPTPAEPSMPVVPPVVPGNEPTMPTPEVPAMPPMGEENPLAPVV